MATTRPPMIETAMGPHSTSRDSGIMARMAAAAVRVMGRKRRTVASRTASHGVCPSSMSCRIWSTRMTVLRMMMPASAMVPSMATKPKGRPETSSAATTPTMPSGAVSITISTSEKRRSCSISSVRISPTISGMPLMMEACALTFSSSGPPASMW